MDFDIFYQRILQKKEWFENRGYDFGPAQTEETDNNINGNKSLLYHEKNQLHIRHYRAKRHARFGTNDKQPSQHCLYFDG